MPSDAMPVGRCAAGQALPQCNQGGSRGPYSLGVAFVTFACRANGPLLFNFQPATARLHDCEWKVELFVLRLLPFCTKSFPVNDVPALGP